MRWTRRDVDRYDDRVVPDTDAAGRRLHRFRAVPPDAPEDGTGPCAVADGLVSLTPLRLDLTDRTALAAAPSGRGAATARSG